MEFSNQIYHSLGANESAGYSNSAIQIDLFSFLKNYFLRFISFSTLVVEAKVLDRSLAAYHMHLFRTTQAQNRNLLYCTNQHNTCIIDFQFQSSFEIKWQQKNH